jgi:hypothetical protein
LIEGNTLTARGLLVFVSLTSGARSLYKTASDGDGREDDGNPTRMVVEIRVHESTPRESALTWKIKGNSTYFSDEVGRDLVKEGVSETTSLLQ